MWHAWRNGRCTPLPRARRTGPYAARAAGGRRKLFGSGFAIFSFASRGGVRLLFSDPDFSGFLDRAKFQLIVGVDAVTTPDVLTMLADEATSYAGLQARVFLHSRKAALFHPKVCWFYNT